MLRYYYFYNKILRNGNFISVFLGPIHIWLFNKIKLQNELTDAIIKTAKENEIYNTESGNIDEKCGKLEAVELFDIIDENNIHGWLAKRVEVVERRLIY